MIWILFCLQSDSTVVCDPLFIDTFGENALEHLPKWMRKYEF